MIFFQPKKEHKDHPFLFQLNTELNECESEPGYEGKGVVYMLDVTYRGVADYVSYIKKDGEPFLLRNSNALFLKTSEALYAKLSDARVAKGNYVKINLTEFTNPKGIIKTVWNVELQDAATVPQVVNNVQNGSKSVNIPISSGTLGVTWGMCINNATKIVISWKEDYKTLDFMRDDIEDVAFLLMDLAVDGLKRWEQEHYQKDQNDEPMIEEETKLEEEDLPF